MLTLWLQTVNHQHFPSCLTALPRVPEGRWVFSELGYCPALCWWRPCELCAVAQVDVSADVTSRAPGISSHHRFQPQITFPALSLSQKHLHRKRSNPFLPSWGRVSSSAHWVWGSGLGVTPGYASVYLPHLWPQLRVFITVRVDRPGTPAQTPGIRQEAWGVGRWQRACSVGAELAWIVLAVAP